MPLPLRQGYTSFLTAIRPAQVTPNSATTNAAEKSPLRGDRAYYIEEARRAAIRHGIPEHTFIAQINQESGFNPKAGSYAGAQGIAQIVPKHHPAMRGKTYDPLASLDYAAALMRRHLNKYGDMRLALAAYNGGEGAARYLKRHQQFLDNPDSSAHRDSWRNQSANYQKKILAAAGVGGISQPAVAVPSISQRQLQATIPEAVPSYSSAAAVIDPIESYRAVAGIAPAEPIAQARRALVQYTDNTPTVAGIYAPLNTNPLGFYE